MKFGIIGNLEKPGLADAVERLIRQLDTHKAGYVIDEQIVKLLSGRIQIKPGNSLTAARCAVEADMVVAFGGDGTILSAARAVGEKGIPILGINLGKLGFLAELAREEMEQAVGDILAGKYIIEERLVLAAQSQSIPGKVLHAVNDIVVDKSRSSRIIDLELHINGAFAVSYRGDGLIISTPTGSTAYALSNGGPIITPTSGVIGITPIAPHTLSGRPLIVPETSTISVIVHGNSAEVLLSSDGQIEELLAPPVEIQIQKAKYNLKLVKRMDRTYFDVLRAKLLWGKDVRSA